MSTFVLISTTKTESDYFWGYCFQVYMKKFNVSAVHQYWYLEFNYCAGSMEKDDLHLAQVFCKILVTSYRCLDCKLFYCNYKPKCNILTSPQLRANTQISIFCLIYIQFSIETKISLINTHCKFQRTIFLKGIV